MASCVVVMNWNCPVWPMEPRQSVAVRMEGYGSPAVSNDGRRLNGGYGWLETECCRCKKRASLLDGIRRARDTPIWKLEPSFRCHCCTRPSVFGTATIVTIHGIWDGTEDLPSRLPTTRP